MSSSSETPFLVKLYDLIEGRQYKDCIAWHYSNKDEKYYIWINCQDGLLERALVSIGVHMSNLQSFSRKLRGLGFTCIINKCGVYLFTNGISVVYSHSLFQKGNRDDVWSIYGTEEKTDTVKVDRNKIILSSERLLIATPFGVACHNCEKPTPIRHERDCRDHLRRCWSNDDTRKPTKLFRIAEQKAISLRDANVAQYLLKGTTTITQCSNCQKKWEKRSTAIAHCDSSSPGCALACLKNVSCRKTTCGRWVPVASISKEWKVSSSAQVTNHSKFEKAVFSYGWPMKDQVEFDDPLTTNDSLASSDNLAIAKSPSDTTDSIRSTDGGNDFEALNPVEPSTPPRQSGESVKRVSVSTMIRVDPTPARQADNVAENVSVSNTTGRIFDDAEDDGSNDIEMQITDEPTAENSDARSDSSTSDDSLIVDDSSISESTSDASASVSGEADEGEDFEVIEPSRQQGDSVDNLSASEMMGGIFDDAEDDSLPPEVFPPSLQPTHTPPANQPPFRKRRVVMAEELLRMGMEMPVDNPLPRPGLEPWKRRERSAAERREANETLLLDDAKDNSKRRRRPRKKVRINTTVQEASPVQLPRKAIPQRRSGGAVMKIGRSRKHRR